MATRGAAAAFVIWKHRSNPSLRSLSSHHFYPVFKPQIIPKGFRYQIRAIQGASVDPVTQLKNNDEPKPENWKIKMLYDGDCPLCMREVNMLKERNEENGTIKFVDISSNDYSPQENQGLDYKTVMGQIHAIQSDGNVVTGVEAFRKLYEEVGLGWVYTITKFEPVKPLSCKLDSLRIFPLLSCLVLRSLIKYFYLHRSVVRTAAGNLKLNRRSLIPNDAVSHFPPAATTLIPSLDHIHRSFSSSKSTKSTITKTKKSEGKKSKSKGGEASSAGGAEDGEFGGSAGDDLESGRAKRLADDEKIPSLDVGPNGRPLFTPRDVTLSKLSHKDIGSYFKFDEAALKAVLPEGLASGIEDEFKESWRPALLVRKSFLDLRDNFRRIADPPTWPTEAKGGVKPKKQIILDGPVKSGKSIALAMLVHWARDEGWLVLYAPKGRDWTHGGYFYKNPHTGFWDTPLQAESILKDFVTFNEPRLRELRCNVYDPIVLGEGAGVGYLKGQDNMPIPEDSTLYDLVQMGIKSTHAAVSVVVRLRKELSLVKDVPVLIAIDQYNNWFTFSEFEEPVTPRSCRPIHARELTTVNAFRSMMHDDMMVGAFSHSTAVGKLRKDLPDVPADARQAFPRYSLDEAEAVCYYYLRQRLVRREVFSEENWKKIYYLANGNGAEMRWLVPFMR